MYVRCVRFQFAPVCYELTVQFEFAVRSKLYLYQG